MASPLAPVAHHSESVNPTLWKWIQHQIDVTTGLSAITIVIIFAIRSKKHARSMGRAAESDDRPADQQNP